MVVSGRFIDGYGGQKGGVGGDGGDGGGVGGGEGNRWERPNWVTIRDNEADG